MQHAPWTCRWGRSAGTASGGPAPASEPVWDCCQPVRCPVRRAVRIDECESCPYWEASAVPPCAAIGWEGD
jgi:hypothetical protein